jgi:regulator of replication initiation timing
MLKWLGGGATALLSIGAILWNLFRIINYIKGIEAGVKEINTCNDKQQKIIERLLSENQDIKQQLERVIEQNHQLKMRTLMLMVSSKDIPLEERLRAGAEYVDNNGNGLIKALYHTLDKEYQKSLEE